jgi:DNA polymerase III subunit gamma/tau
VSPDPATHPADRRGLALRYRPRRLAELTGQRHVATVLGRLIVRGDVPRQLLLSGGSGLGKTTVGRIVAAALLCETPIEERPEGDACAACSSCDEVTAAVPTHPDVIELDAASHGGKDEIREIAARAQLSPLRGRFKVYIVDEVHALSGPGGQAFLKLLEEPPPHVVFVLCTTNPEKLSTRAGGAGTIRGRCTELELLRPSEAQLVANLQRIAAGEGLVLGEELAALLVEATDPDLGVRGTVMTLEKASALLGSHDPDPDAVAAVVGAVPSAAFGRMITAVDGGQPAAALAALDELRAASSDRAVRTRLLRWGRSQLTEAAAGAGELALAARRLAAVATALPGPAGTDLLVAELAAGAPTAGDDPRRAVQPSDAPQAPAPAPTSDAPSAELAELEARTATAERAIAHLGDLLERAREEHRQLSAATSAATDAAVQAQDSAAIAARSAALAAEQGRALASGAGPETPPVRPEAANSAPEAERPGPTLAGPLLEEPVPDEPYPDVPYPDEPYPDEPYPDEAPGEDRWSQGPFSGSAPAVSDPPAPRARKRPDKATERGGARPARGAPRREAPRSGDQDPGREVRPRPVAPAPAARAGAHQASDRHRRLLEQVAGSDRGAAELLAGCQVRFLANRLVVTTPDAATRSELGQPHRYAVLTTAARAIGAGRLVLE